MSSKVIIMQTSEDEPVIERNTLKPSTYHGNLTFIYDILTILISLADFVTDLYILYQYYTLNRITFFIISCIIISITQITYCIAFTLVFSSSNDPFSVRLCIFIKSLPFAPLLSFRFYFITDKQPIDHNTSKLNQWLQIQFIKHKGFIIESAVESFPQSILQMIAIIYYQEADVIAVISILMSILSMSWKSLIFSRSIDPMTLIWNWLCCVTDFCGIFCTISWVFYNPNNIWSGLTLIGKIWIFKMVICVLPTAAYTALGASFAIFVKWVGNVSITQKNKYLQNITDYKTRKWQQSHSNEDPGNATQTELDDIKYPIIYKLLFWLKLFIFLLLMLIAIISLLGFGAIFLALILEIIWCVYFPYLLYEFGVNRISHSDAAAHDFWIEIFEFLQNAKNEKDSPNDRLLRVLAINRIIERQKNQNVGIREYLDKHENDKIMPYHDATWNGLYESVSDPMWLERRTVIVQIIWVYYTTLFKAQYDEFIVVKNNSNHVNIELIGKGMFLCCSVPLTFILLPLYLVSRILSMLFPIIIVVWLSVDGLWKKMDLFLFSMLALYFFVFCLMVIIGGFVLRLQNAVWYIMPERTLSRIKSSNDAKLRLNKIKEYYIECKMIKQRELTVCQYFGNDVGVIILQYIARFDDERPFHAMFF